MCSTKSSRIHETLYILQNPWGCALKKCIQSGLKNVRYRGANKRKLGWTKPPKIKISPRPPKKIEIISQNWHYRREEAQMEGRGLNKGQRQQFWAVMSKIFFALILTNCSCPFQVHKLTELGIPEVEDSKEFNLVICKDWYCTSIFTKFRLHS